MHFLRPRQSRAGLVQNLHFGKPALLHWNPAQHASSFCFTSCGGSFVFPEKPVDYLYTFDACLSPYEGSHDPESRRDALRRRVALQQNGFYWSTLGIPCEGRH